MGNIRWWTGFVLSVARREFYLNFSKDDPIDLGRIQGWDNTTEM